MMMKPFDLNKERTRFLEGSEGSISKHRGVV